MNGAEKYVTSRMPRLYEAVWLTVLMSHPTNAVCSCIIECVHNAKTIHKNKDLQRQRRRFVWLRIYYCFISFFTPALSVSLSLSLSLSVLSLCIYIYIYIYHSCTVVICGLPLTPFSRLILSLYTPTRFYNPLDIRAKWNQMVTNNT